MDTPRDVHLRELIAASAQAAVSAWPAVLLVWVARGLLEALTPILRAIVNAETGYATRSFTALPWLTGVLLALVSGLFIRWLLEPRRESLRLDVGLVAYVILIEVFKLIYWAGFWLSRVGPRQVGMPSEIFVRWSLGLLMNLLLGLAFAAVVLWPIALMMGTGCRYEGRSGGWGRPTAVGC